MVTRGRRRGGALRRWHRVGIGLGALVAAVHAAALPASAEAGAWPGVPVPDAGVVSVQMSSPESPSVSSYDGRRPFVVIRFAPDAAPFEGPLYEALRDALARRPGLRLDVVAVGPTVDSLGAAEAQAERVFRSLVALGMPAERLGLAAATRPDAAGSEVRLYAR